MGSLGLAFRYALRELRGGLKGFYVFLACLALGVAAIAGVASLSQGIDTSLSRDGRGLLGGDVEFRLIHREASAEELAWLKAQGKLSTVLQMRAMAHAGDRRTLVEIKSADQAYPLYGSVQLDPPMPLADALRDGGVAVDETLLGRLGIKVGDRLTVGDEALTVRARVVREADRATEGLTLGPRVLMATAALERTGLITPGSLIYYQYRLALPPDRLDSAVMNEAKTKFPDAGWRVRDWRNASPGLRQFFDRVGLFLVLVGLTALLVGGVGVGNATRAYLEGKTATIATLKCLGASGADIFRIYLVQILILALIGIVIGLALGAALPVLLVRLIGDMMPIPVELGIYPQALGLALLYGLLIALAFALWPLARARDVAPAGLFRDLVAPTRRWPRPAYLGAMLAALGLAATVAVATTDERRFALMFVGGAIASFVVLRLAATLIQVLARRAGRPRSTALRFAVTSLHRPGSATASVVLSLGLGLTLLVGIALIQGNLTRQIDERLPKEAPSFFFVDIQPDQVEGFEQTVRAVPGAGEIRRVASLRGRISQVNGVPADKIAASPEQRWVLRGDRGLTYSAALPDNNEIVEGAWWPADYNGPPLVSLEAEAAKGLGLKVGDRITVNVLGREMEATIASLRKLDWTSFSLNFVLIFSPGVLEAAPHTHIATVKADPAAEDAIFRAVTDRYANISAIRLKEAIDQAQTLIAAVGAAVRGAAAVTLVAGLLVLGGAIAAGHRRRVREAVIFKVLGATRADIARAYLLEYALLGLVTAVVAGLIGWAVAWGVVTQVMKAPWIFLPWTMIGTAVGGTALTVVLGLLGTWRALSERPAPALRHA